MIKPEAEIRIILIRLVDQVFGPSPIFLLYELILFCKRDRDAEGTFFVRIFPTITYFCPKILL